MDPDEATFTAMASAMAANHMIERLLKAWAQREPNEAAKFATEAAAQLTERLATIPVKGPRLGREALFRNALQLELDLLKSITPQH